MIGNDLFANHLMFRLTESQLEPNKYMSLRTWYQRKEAEQLTKPPSERERPMHPSCVARLVCKLFAERLRLLITSEFRANGTLRIGGVRIQTETVVLESITHLLMSASVFLESPVERQRCKLFFITSWTARIAEAIMRTKNPDLMAKQAYSALKFVSERYLGNAKRNTGEIRNLYMRAMLARIFQVLAVPVDYRSETAVLGPKQRRRRPLENIICTAYELSLIHI